MEEEDEKKIRLPIRERLQVLLEEADPEKRYHECFIPMLTMCAGREVTPEMAAKIIIAASVANTDLQKRNGRKVVAIIPGGVMAAFLLQDQEMIEKTSAAIFHAMKNAGIQTIHVYQEKGISRGKDLRYS